MGIFLSLWASLFFSINLITVRKGVTKLGVPTGTIIMLLTGAVSTLLIALIQEGVQVLWPVKLESLMYFVLGGVIHFLGGWGFQNASAARIGPMRLGAMIGSTPLFAVILAFIFLNQVVNFYILLGIFLIVVGVLTITTGKTNE